MLGSDLMGKLLVKGIKDDIRIMKTVYSGVKDELFPAAPQPATAPAPSAQVARQQAAPIPQRMPVYSQQAAGFQPAAPAQAAAWPAPSVFPQPPQSPPPYSAFVASPALPPDVKTWRPEHVCAWFAALGPAYTPFGHKAKQLEVDGAVLLTMNEAGLAELGCTSKLQQTKVMQQLDKLRGGAVPYAAPLSPVSPKSPAYASPQSHAQSPSQAPFSPYAASPQRVVVAAVAAPSPSPSPKPAAAPPPAVPAVSVNPAAVAAPVVRVIAFPELGPLRQLASGHYATCYLSTWAGQQVVVKMPKKDDHDVISEIPALSSLPPHRNLLPLLGACFSPLCLVSPFAAGGSLENAIRAHAEFKAGKSRTRPALDISDPQTVVRIALETATGLSVLHAAGLVHRDVAARNLLLDADTTVRLADFGLARSVNTAEAGAGAVYAGVHRNALPFPWMAPECFSEQKFSAKSDVWSFAVTMWEVFNGGAIPFSEFKYENAHDFGSKLIAKQMWLTFKSASPPTPAIPCSTQLAALLNRCLSHAPAERPTAAEAVAALSAMLHDPSWAVAAAAAPARVNIGPPPLPASLPPPLPSSPPPALPASPSASALASPPPLARAQSAPSAPVAVVAQPAPAAAVPQQRYVGLYQQYAPAKVIKPGF